MMRTLFIIVLTHLSYALANLPRYWCPRPYQNPVEVKIQTNQPATSVRLRRGDLSSTCVLVHLTPSSPDMSLDNVNSTSPSSDFVSIPVARSYKHNKNVWERVSGLYSDAIKISNCKTLFCTVQIPKIGGAEKGKFFLMTFKHSLNEREEVSRFFGQTTFGPTLDMINDWDYNKKFDMQSAWWVKKQMNPDVIEPTYHRVFYRENMSSHVKAKHRGFDLLAQHPCSQYSRWRDYTFRKQNRGNIVYTLKHLEGKSCLISINGFPRSVVDDCYAYYDEMMIPEGKYKVCAWSGEELNGYLGLYAAVGGDCIYNYWELDENNPPIKLDALLNDTEYADDFHIINLPSKSEMSLLDPLIEFWQGYTTIRGSGFYLKNEITDDKCSNIPISYYQDIYGLTSDGTYMVSNANIHFKKNDLDTKEATFDGEVTTGGLDCPNVAKSFLNLDSCSLSNSPLACSPDDDDVSFGLSEDALRKLYKSSGTRYTYAIVNFPRTLGPSPCTLLKEQRWLKIDEPSETCISDSVDDDTKETLATVILDWISNINGNYLDIPETFEYDGNCDTRKSVTNRMKLFVRDGDKEFCFQHQHPDEGTVWDFTYYALQGDEEDALHPIKKWASTEDQFIIDFSAMNPNPTWYQVKKNLDNVGLLGNEIYYKDLPQKFLLSSVADAFGVNQFGEGIVVCGSPGEVANNLSASQNMFSSINASAAKLQRLLDGQKKTVWTMIALMAKDQLRQRVAWALSQILVITPFQINLPRGYSEIYLNYYDIFVRNAFGNYWDILKEVSYSPLMGEMLSFVDSRSSAYVLENDGYLAFPDENFAREIMQLFTIGLVELNMDGSILKDDNGNPVQTYDNSDIQTFAKAWTGFTRVPQRFNMEKSNKENRIDPMHLSGLKRDVTPKMNVMNGFIGDTYPLCQDLPTRQFLSKGARYQLLGRIDSPDLQHEPKHWKGNEYLKRFELNKRSSLYQALCNKSKGSCDFKMTVDLKENLACYKGECALSSLSILQVQQDPPIYYEYVRPACVNLAFYDNEDSIKISREWQSKAMCAQKKLDVARVACCSDSSSDKSNAEHLCQYTGERVSYNNGEERCMRNNANTCDWLSITSEKESCSLSDNNDWYWTDKPCEILAKVNDVGMVAIVHDPNLDINDNHDGANFEVHQIVDSENQNFFKVQWFGGSYPSAKNNCASESCDSHPDGCLCPIKVKSSSVFRSHPRSQKQVLAKLKVGNPPPLWYKKGTYQWDSTKRGIAVFHKTGGKPYDENTIFGVEVHGKYKYFKNMRSIVVVDRPGVNYKFRNPPQFLHIHMPSTRDAMYETDAVLDHFFYHKNMAPFLAIRLIQRFGISNPSPRYIKKVASSFVKGKYSNHKVMFGNGEYGNLESMVAAIVLDREARNVGLDADPANGSLKEPIMKLIGLMRAMEFAAREDTPEIILNVPDIGQEPHSIPNVFSYFLPEYSAPQTMTAELTSPEAQVLNTPAIISFMNGIISLVDLGLTRCFGGFGVPTTSDCYYEDTDIGDKSMGFLRFFATSMRSDLIVDEVSMLLTGGRLSETSRAKIIDILDNSQGCDKLPICQKLILSSPEFHSNSVFSPLSLPRQEEEPAEPTGKGYKSIILVNLDGGMDAFNMLIPHSNCTGEDMYEQYKDVRRSVALNKETLHKIDASSSSQPCDNFGFHPNLPFFKELFDDGDVTFFANTGILQEPTTRANWLDVTTETKLFAHNIQQKEIQNIDIFAEDLGRGVCGRISDAMLKDGFTTISHSFAGITDALTSAKSKTLVATPSGQKFDPIPYNADLKEAMKEMNSATSIGSGIFSELWSDLFSQALVDNDSVVELLEETNLSTRFPSIGLTSQFRAISKLMKRREDRKIERDIFYAQMNGFDTHASIGPKLVDLFDGINGPLEALVSELKEQGVWNQTTVVFVSEFARTLRGNSGEGTDHAWGAIPFIVGGAVKGGEILGEYPSDLRPSSTNPVIFEPGIAIPRLPLDAMWNGVAEWFGIKNETVLDEVLPNRGKFTDDLFHEEDLFE